MNFWQLMAHSFYCGTKTTQWYYTSIHAKMRISRNTLIHTAGLRQWSQLTNYLHYLSFFGSGQFFSYGVSSGYSLKHYWNTADIKSFAKKNAMTLGIVSIIYTYMTILTA